MRFEDIGAKAPITITIGPGQISIGAPLFVKRSLHQLILPGDFASISPHKWTKSSLELIS
jgi:hypothetical protein